jgi:cell division protein FtsB
MRIVKYLIIVTVIGGYLIVFGDRGLRDNQRKTSYLENLQSQNRQIQEENFRIERKISLLKDDPVYIESIARRELGMVGKNDVVYRFIK